MPLTAINTSISNPILLRALRRIEQELLDRTAIAQYQYVDVTFNSVANGDTIIVTSLQPLTPEQIDYTVVEWRLPTAPVTAPVAYTDSGASRRAWAEGYIVLRCNVASAAATLLLTVRT